MCVGYVQTLSFYIKDLRTHDFGIWGLLELILNK